jgi:hypothetical protein
VLSFLGFILTGYLITAALPVSASVSAPVSTPVRADEYPASQPTSTFRDPQQLQLAKKLLTDAILLFDEEFRNPASGQYYDAVNVSESGPSNLAATVNSAPPAKSNLTLETNSSTAATGMGLVSLAIGDATGTVSNANIKVVQTLAAILNPRFSKRHSQGWLRHWFNAQDGRDNSWSPADGYSTVDTAILAAGAVLSANYFKASGKDPENVIEDLTTKLLTSVNWASAIADMNSGRLYMSYNLASEAPQHVTSKFNEYILVSCMGKLAEARRGKSGPMTEFWNRHFANPDTLPQKIYPSLDGPVPVLTDSPFRFLSNFTIQFAYYLCGEVNNNSKYIRYFKNALRMDQDWFQRQPVNRAGYWGLGAGEAVRGYQANAGNNNPDLIISPQIVSGFMSEKPEALSDLTALYDAKIFSYNLNGKEILWRRSLLYPEKSLARLQAVDYSTMLFGLASVQPGIGSEFFKTFAGRAK